jgi:hypothetical protein
MYPDGGPRIFPFGKNQNWRFSYDPKGNGGAGLLRVDLDGESLEFPLPPGMKEQTGRLTRFGMLPWHNKGGAAMRVYLDDLSYTGGPLSPPF